MIERSNILRPFWLFLGSALWLFLLFSLGSFHATDWPSHSVYPYGVIQNVCGTVGAFIAYYSFLAIGQGVFPLLFFTGVCLALLIYQDQLTDFWLRAAGLTLLCVAFAAVVHHFKPGGNTGFPEGHGGLVGIGTAAFLQSHFNTIGTRLVLLTAILIGLLLTADDLVLRAPAMAVQAYSSVRTHAPKIKFAFPAFPKLPSLPGFVTRDAKTPRTRAKAPAKAKAVETDEKDSDKPEPAKKKARPKQLDPWGATTDEDEAALQSTDILEDEDDSAAETEAEIEAEEAEVKPPAPRPEIIVKLPSMMKPRQVSPPTPPPRELGEYHLPSWDCLADAEHGFAESQEKFVREKAADLEKAMEEFNIDARVVEIDTGPVITMYELELAPGVKVSSITALSNDIMRALRAETVRIVAPVPGKNTVGIEAPNAEKEKVRLKELMLTAPDATKKFAIPLYLGKDASGEPLIHDMTQMTHCLIAGTTGSGKSVCINTIIMSIIYQQRPDNVKLILIDPKVVEMAPFKDIPHLMCPVINDASRATSVLEWACEKMDERYEFLAEAGVRNIKGYNALTREELVERFKPSDPEEEAKIPKHLPYIVIIIDELADLMMTSGKEVEGFIVRLAQKSRAVGIHLILATQRPQANVVTGLIKSNMPTRIAFRVSSKMDSRIVLDQNGADLLLGQGDMLFLPPGASKPTRGQGTYIDDKEMRESVKIVKELAEAQYEPELVQIKPAGTVDDEAAQDDLFDAAVRVVLETKRGSVSLLQRRLTIGYSRASRLIEAMAAGGIVGSYKGSQAREAMITIDEWDAMQAARQADAASGMTV
ncbi:MAG: DNA translocase FtsK [Planctomycetota bacterium]|nr:DNA translocase FtsK [Planctomycetota bacterium]